MKPRAPTETPLDPSPASSRPSVAIAGLLIVCGVLATGLVATAYANERAAVRAATAVLRGRAQDTTNAAIALLRISRRMHKPLDLTDVAKASARDGVEVAFIDPRRQRLLARAGGSETTAPVLGSVAKIPAEVRIALRAQGQATRSKDNVFELWRPFFVGRGPGPGRHGQGRGLGRRWRRRHPAGPLQPQGIRPPEAHPPRRPKHRPRAFTLLRVRVPRHLASEVTAAARSTLIFAAASALLLLLSAAGLFRAARRAQRTAVELRRRETLSSLGEMAAILAHEIRTPLGSMKGNAQLLAEDAPKDDRASAIVDEATRLERLVNGMLDVARPAPPRHETINPDLVAERAAEIVAPLAAKSGVTLLTDPAGDAPTLDADPDKLLQVLVNLL
ncbi:MAG: hypothetical protein KAI47_19610, partial [Deltaproteobacteria bacterium]|nr:hypothetical protein [Deltaproteobacteria bacterium]